MYLELSGARTNTVFLAIGKYHLELRLKEQKLKEQCLPGSKVRSISEQFGLKNFCLEDRANSGNVGEYGQAGLCPLALAAGAGQLSRTLQTCHSSCPPFISFLLL